MSIQLRGLHSAVRAAAEFALQVARFNGIEPVVTSTYRSWQEQSDLRRRFEQCVASGTFGRKPGCMFPANKPGDSAHNFGLAWDSVVPAADQPVWDAIREWIGWRVPANDRIHAEVPDWRSWVH